MRASPSTSRLGNPTNHALLLSTYPEHSDKTTLRYACAIPDPGGAGVVVTGGSQTRQLVTRYSQAGRIARPQYLCRYGVSGWEAELPELLEGREKHGCAGYTTQAGLAVLVVAGGWSGSHYLASTELLLGSEALAWQQAAPLPSPVSRLQVDTNLKPSGQQTQTLLANPTKKN